jgi:hypothetical protein
MATDPSIMNIFIGLMAVIGLESIVLILIMWKTPALTFLKASLLKAPIMYIIGKDRMGYFKTFKSENGAAKLGKDGLYHLTESSHTLEAGSKIPIYFAFRDLAATLLPEYPAIIQEIREKGVVINNIEDVLNYIKKIKSGMAEDLPVQVHAYKTYKFHDLENMFPNNLDPTFIDSTVQCEIAKGLKMMKMTPTIIGGAVVLVMVAAVAVFIVQKAFKGNISIEECQAMIGSVKAAASTVSTAVAASGPIVP